MMAPVVEARGLARRHLAGRGLAVDALLPAWFRIEAAARIALTGPSGSGKSTLLQLLADLDAPSGGSIAWPALGAHGALRPTRIGMVFQVPTLLPTLSVIENVQVPLLLAGRVAGAEDQARLALAAVGLAELAEALPEDLSGGQAQRVGIARALASRPALLLADEPTGQLDQATAQAVLDALLAALADTDTALVLATHDPHVAARMAQVWRLSHGVLDTGAALGDGP